MIIVTQSPGRLGNRLWTFANILAFCFDKNVQWWHADAADLLAVCRSLEIHGRTNPCSHLCSAGLKMARKVRVHGSLCLADGEYTNLDDSPEIANLLQQKKTIQLSGFYFAAPDSLARNKSVVLQALQFDDVIWERARKSVQLGESLNCLNVALHLRRGDYREFLGGMMYYSDEAYRTIANSVKNSSTERIRLHLFSDEQISERIIEGLDAVIHRNNAAVLDLAIMASCDAIIGPNSSFSQWASFIGDVPLYVLNPDFVSRMAGEVSLPLSSFSPFTADQFGDKASKRISVASRLVRPLL